MLSSNQIKKWTVGDSATYEGEVVTIKWIEGLFADLQDTDGHNIRDAQVSLLRPVLSGTRPRPSPPVADTMSTGATLPLDLSGVEEAMARPLATITWEELVGPPTEEPEPVTIQPEAAAPAKAPRRYLTEGYTCDLCPGLSFPKSSDKARHVRSKHPKPKPGTPPTLTQAAPAVAPAAAAPANVAPVSFWNSSFRLGLIAERARLLAVVDAIDVLLAHLDQH